MFWNICPFDNRTCSRLLCFNQGLGGQKHSSYTTFHISLEIPGKISDYFLSSKTLRFFM